MAGNNNPVVTLTAQASNFDYKALKAKAITEEGRKDIDCGGVAFRDLPRMNFVINGKNIDKNFINQLYEKYNDLIPKNEDKEKSYHPFLKEIFKKMFNYPDTEVPSDPILKELITNCNQSGYEGTLFTDVLFQAFNQSTFILLSPQKTININCTNPNCIEVKSDMKVPVVSSNNPEENVGELSSSLEFTLESQEGKDSVTYKDGKLSLTIPKELKNYKIGGKNLFDAIVEYFQKFCEKLGFKFDIKVEHKLDEQVNTNLTKIRSPALTTWYVHLD